ncbi:MAG: hypothetical protein EBX41_00625 [Chitinophagia bacterium]|nr:hypothetical protein [Chitinophagia bacterium]
MYSLNDFIEFIKIHDKIPNKNRLINLCAEEFKLVKDRSVYYCNSFAVRFSYSSSGTFSNTILSLSALQKYDHIPFIVCLITNSENRLFLANSTFLIKISHSSQTLTEKNIKGSFNGSDIAKNFQDIENNRTNIFRLFAIHSEIGFDGNLNRLVEATHAISPTGKKFEVGIQEKSNIQNSIQRAINFCGGPKFNTLKEELDEKVDKFKNEILIASHIENVNIRGRIIEYLIAGDNENLKEKLIQELTDDYSKLPAFKTENTLGDYVKVFEEYRTETDIKTKIIILNSNPKAYNIDKFLEFHNRGDTVFLFYFIGIDKSTIFNKTLNSVFQKDLIKSTILLKHWAGRNSRGVTQFEGTVIKTLLEHPNNEIDLSTAIEFVSSLYDL